MAGDETSAAGSSPTTLGAIKKPGVPRLRARPALKPILASRLIPIATGLALRSVDGGRDHPGHGIDHDPRAACGFLPAAANIRIRCARVAFAAWPPGDRDESLTSL